jgi:hypothetical protein
MKKFIIVFISLIFFVSCNQNTDDIILKKHDFSKEEKGLVDGIGLKNIFIFESNKNLKKNKVLDLWVEIYENGTSIGKDFATDINLSDSKKLYIMFNDMYEDKEIININSARSELDKDSSNDFSTYKYLVNPNKINLSKSEFILVIKIANKENNVNSIDDNIFKDFESQKEILFKNECVYLVKGKLKNK